jgi:pyrimidine-nucleoside phosphorylase
MNQPLGEAVGNALETREAIETLQGGGPEDFREHCLVVASHMLVLGNRAASLDEGRQMAEKALADGSGLEFFRTLVREQGGDVSYVDHPDKLPRATLIETVNAPRSGWLKAVKAKEIGETSVELGAGRARKGDPIDFAVGIMVHHKVGAHVEAGDALFTVHANDADRMAQAIKRLQDAVEWSDTACEPLPLFYGVVK